MTLLFEQALSSLIQSCFSLPSGFQLPAQVVCAAQAAAPTALQEAKAFSKGGKVNQVRGQRWADTGGERGAWR